MSPAPTIATGLADCAATRSPPDTSGCRSMRGIGCGRRRETPVFRGSTATGRHRDVPQVFAAPSLPCNACRIIRPAQRIRWTRESGFLKLAHMKHPVYKTDPPSRVHTRRRGVCPVVSECQIAAMPLK
jgi:hypothetical protein